MANIKTLIKKAVKSLLPKNGAAYTREKNVVQNESRNQNIYYSQEGEDIILERIFSEKENGFYIDIGAHHPTRFSNTYKLYLRGWRGINIDATPGSMIPFEDIRPEDINLEMGISATEKEIEYYIMDEPALNTFFRERVDHLIADTPYNLINSVVVKTKTLGNVLKQFLPAGKHIDFLTIDVEGLDFEILESNDWTKYRPYIVLTEEWSGSLEDI
ncbi:MAG: FkbM family methyltransferase [Chitinophagaceae bacterium]